jgi:hypothetical protein
MMNPIKIVKRALIAAVTIFAFANVMVQPVLAQQTTCPPRYIIVIQPYGITCLPPTPFAIGSVVINDATMVALLVVFAAVFAVVVNAIILKSKVKKI